jgi:hypothetical protein
MSRLEVLQFRRRFSRHGRKEDGVPSSHRGVGEGRVAQTLGVQFIGFGRYIICNCIKKYGVDGAFLGGREGDRHELLAREVVRASGDALRTFIEKY